MINIVESPVDSKIFLKIKKEGSYTLKEIALTQIFNYRITENKKPVYSFNNKEFEQVIRGKRLIECAIVIKKSVVSELWKIINSNSTYNNYLNMYIKNKIDYMNSVGGNTERVKSLLTQYQEEAIEHEKYELNKKGGGTASDILDEMPEDMELLISFGTGKQEYNNTSNEYNSVQEDDIYKYIEKNSKLLITNINFYEYSGEVNISNTSIDEVFKMFGKVKYKKEV